MNALPIVAGIFGMQEGMVVLALILLFFGASRMPGIARSLGRSVNEFKQGMKDEPEPQKPSSPTADSSHKN